MVTLLTYKPDKIVESAQSPGSISEKKLDERSCSEIEKLTGIHFAQATQRTNSSFLRRISSGLSRIHGVFTQWVHRSASVIQMRLHRAVDAFERDLNRRLHPLRETVFQLQHAREQITTHLQAMQSQLETLRARLHRVRDYVSGEDVRRLVQMDGATRMSLFVRPRNQEGVRAALKRTVKNVCNKVRRGLSTGFQRIKVACGFAQSKHKNSQNSSSDQALTYASSESTVPITGVFVSSPRHTQGHYFSEAGGDMEVNHYGEYLPQYNTYENAMLVNATLCPLMFFVREYTFNYTLLIGVTDTLANEITFIRTMMVFMSFLGEMLGTLLFQSMSSRLISIGTEKEPTPLVEKKAEIALAKACLQEKDLLTDCMSAGVIPEYAITLLSAHSALEELQAQWETVLPMLEAHTQTPKNNVFSELKKTLEHLDGRVDHHTLSELRADMEGLEVDFQDIFQNSQDILELVHSVRDQALLENPTSFLDTFEGFFSAYFPTQNLEKTPSRTSSVTESPVISPN